MKLDGQWGDCEGLVSHCKELGFHWMGWKPWRIWTEEVLLFSKSGNEKAAAVTLMTGYDGLGQGGENCWVSDMVWGRTNRISCWTNVEHERKEWVKATIKV